MGLFDQPLERVNRALRQWSERGLVREWDVDPVRPGSTGPSIVLADEVGLELGHPEVGSLSLLLWSEAPAERDDRVVLVGPQPADAPGVRAPLAQVVVVYGRFQDAYDCHRSLRDALYSVALPGVTARHFPGRQRIWYRIAETALADGLDARRLGSAVARDVRELPFVEGAGVLLVTAGADEAAHLQPAARQTQDITAALTKMAEEEQFDCVSCDYQDVCDQIDDLRRIRGQLARERRGRQEKNS